MGNYSCSVCYEAFGMGLRMVLQNMKVWAGRLLSLNLRRQNRRRLQRREQTPNARGGNSAHGPRGKTRLARESSVKKGNFSFASAVSDLIFGNVRHEK
jgi:hypothetical protein